MQGKLVQLHEKPEMGIVKWLFVLAVLAMPFGDVGISNVLGELSTELSAYMFGLTIAACYVFMPSLIMKEGKRYISLPLTMFVVLSGAILLSFLLNAPDIMTAHVRGRSGMNKLVTSYMVLALGCFVALVTSVILGRELEKQNGGLEGAFKSLFVKTMCASAIIVFALSLPNALKQFVPAVGVVDNMLGTVIHSGRGVDHLGSRFRGVAQEANFFAAWAGFGIIWLIAAARMAVTRQKKWAIIALMAAITGMLVLSGSRSGYLLLAGIVLMEIAQKYVFAAKLPKEKLVNLLGNMVIIFFIVCVAIVLLKSDQIANAVLEGDSVSNLSRFASNTAAFAMFFQNPIVGVGFGQYGHNLDGYMPYWGYTSVEVENWMFNPESTWPPVFSMIARMGAETGLIGLCVWFGFWFMCLKKILRAAYTQCVEEQKFPVIGVALATSIVYVVLVGVSSDSFRVMGIWVTMGLLSIYLSRWGSARKGV